METGKAIGVAVKAASGAAARRVIDAAMKVATGVASGKATGAAKKVGTGQSTQVSSDGKNSGGDWSSGSVGNGYRAKDGNKWCDEASQHTIRLRRSIGSWQRFSIGNWRADWGSDSSCDW